MEIERKFLLRCVPNNLEQYPCHQIEQGYLCTEPVVRIRRQDDQYILTYKGSGMMVREEYNLPLTEKAYEQLRPKTEGRLIIKKRYVIPLEHSLKAEVDFFEGSLSGLCLAEVEFPDEAAAAAFIPEEWMGEDVTFSKDYHNSTLSLCPESHIRDLLGNS